MAGRSSRQEANETVAQQEAVQRRAPLALAWKLVGRHGTVTAAFSLTCFVILWQVASDYLISPFLVTAADCCRTGGYTDDVFW